MTERRSSRPPKATCKRGHLLTPATTIVQRNGKMRCMHCVTAACQKAARSPRKEPLVRAKPRERKPWLTAFTHNPGLLAECQREYAEALARTAAMLTPSERGRLGGRPRRPQPQTRIVP